MESPLASTKPLPNRGQDQNIYIADQNTLNPSLQRNPYDHFMKTSDNDSILSHAPNPAGLK